MIFKNYIVERQIFNIYFLESFRLFFIVIFIDSDSCFMDQFSYVKSCIIFFSPMLLVFFCSLMCFFQIFLTYLFVLISVFLWFKYLVILGHLVIFKNKA